MSNYSVFLSNRDNNLKPTKEFKKALQTEINDAKNSCQAISRVVHPAAYGRWNAEADKNLLEVYTKHASSNHYIFRTSKGKRAMIENIAKDVNRSPLATKSRLAKLAIITKDNGTKDLLRMAGSLQKKPPKK